MPPLSLLQTSLLRARIKILDDYDVRQYKGEQIVLLKEQAENRRLALRITLAVAAGALGVLAYLFPGGRALYGVLGICVLGALRVSFYFPSKPAWRVYPAGNCLTIGGRTQFQFNPLLGVKATLIPQEVIQIARRISETGISAQFWIEQLADDPFLVVCSWPGEKFEQYVVAVWNEQGFIPGADETRYTENL